MDAADQMVNDCLLSKLALKELTLNFTVCMLLSIVNC